MLHIQDSLSCAGPGLYQSASLMLAGKKALPISRLPPVEPPSLAALAANPLHHRSAFRPNPSLAGPGWMPYGLPRSDTRGSKRGTLQSSHLLLATGNSLRKPCIGEERDGAVIGWTSVKDPEVSLTLGAWQELALQQVSMNTCHSGKLPPPRPDPLATQKGCAGALHC